MDKSALIRLKQRGNSNREVSRILGINRKTVADYWNKYLEHEEKLKTNTGEIIEIQEAMTAAPTYDSSSRKPQKYTEEMKKGHKGDTETQGDGSSVLCFC